MATSFADAVEELYQAPHAAFISERKRLAGELKAAGERAAATRLGKLARPPISAWAVNQLWWHARDGFDQLFETADRLRSGDLGAAAAHRDAIAGLRARAAVMLSEAGHGATEATLRKVTTTLAALAAAGGFDPDPAGALATDRDPPGFGAVGLAAPITDAGEAAEAAPAAAQAATSTTEDSDGASRRRAEAEERRRAEAAAQHEQAEAAAERRRAEQAAARRAAEQHQLEAALRTARGEVERRTREVDRLRQAVSAAETAVARAQAIVDDLEARLAALVEGGN